MEKYFCNGKKDFCDNIENCGECQFADGSGVISSEKIDYIFSSVFGTNYDLSRLRELVQADREGRCVVLPVKPGGLVRFAGNPRAKHEKVDAINIYADGKITFSFHETGMKTRYVDEWSEDESEKYVSVEFDEAALKEREKDES